MSFIPHVICRRCGRQFSGLRARCPYCGTRRVRQSQRVPASSASTDPGSAAGERAESNARWQLIFGGILLLAVILAVVVLVSISLNSSTENPVTTIPNIAAGVTWSSSDESVITCTPSEDNPLVCTLTQVGNGNCIITCTVYGVSATLPMSAYDLPEE